MDDLDPVVVLSGRELSRAWLAVFTAASNLDPFSPLYRRVHIEQHDHGLVLVASSGHWLAQVFVPYEDHDDALPPRLEELPHRAVTLTDDEHRIRDLFRWVAKATRKADAEDVRIVIDLEARHVDEQGTLPGLEALRVAITADDHERHLATLYDAPWVDWRSLAASFPPPAPTAEVSIGPSMLADLARVATLAGGPGVHIEWCGTAAARWNVRSPAILHAPSGMLMTQRLDAYDDPPPPEPGPLDDALDEALGDLAEVADELTISRAGEEPVVVDLTKRRSKRKGTKS